jgi:hypothetical protein
LPYLLAKVILVSLGQLNHSKIEEGQSNSSLSQVSDQTVLLKRSAAKKMGVEGFSLV